jgi:hypothetical protein
MNRITPGQAVETSRTPSENSLPGRKSGNRNVQRTPETNASSITRNENTRKHHENSR